LAGFIGVCLIATLVALVALVTFGPK